MTRQQLWTAVLGVLLLAGPAAAAGQQQPSMLDSSEASAFMGVWVLTMELPRGRGFDQTLTIRDEVGKVTARLEDGRVPGGDDSASIAKDGDTLVLTYEVPVGDLSGRRFLKEFTLTLTLDGEMLQATQDLGDGYFVNGTGKKE